MISRCVTNGTEVLLRCPLREGSDFDYISWDIFDKYYNNLNDYYQEEDTLSFTASWNGSGYDVLEVSCDDGEEQAFYALFIVTGK